MTSIGDRIDLSVTSDDENIAEEFVKRGEIDQAIEIYQQLQSQSARVFCIIGVLYAEKKGCYELAISCYEQALHMQEEDGDDISGILTKLGFAYQNLRAFDLALNYQLRALSLRQSESNIDRRLVASNLFGIANAYWGQKNLSEALTYAQQALIINESMTSRDDSNIASNLAVLANIYHHSGDDIRALELAKRALLLLESSISPDSLVLVSVLNNIGVIQASAGLFQDALLTFVRVFHICDSTVPEDHPKRIAINNNIRKIIVMRRNVANSFSHLWKLLTEFLIF